MVSSARDVHSPSGKGGFNGNRIIKQKNWLASAYSNGAGRRGYRFHSHMAYPAFQTADSACHFHFLSDAKLVTHHDCRAAAGEPVVACVVVARHTPLVAEGVVSADSVTAFAC